MLLFAVSLTVATITIHTMWRSFTSSPFGIHASASMPHYTPPVAWRATDPMPDKCEYFFITTSSCPHSALLLGLVCAGVHIKDLAEVRLQGGRKSVDCVLAVSLLVAYTGGG